MRKLGLCTVLVAALAGCGGGGGDDANINVNNAANSGVSTSVAKTTAEGLWQGSTITGRTVRTLVLDDGTYWTLYSVAGLSNTIAGVVQGSGMSSSGSFTSSAGRDFSLEAASTTDASISATYNSKNFFNGSLTNRASANTVTFTSSYQPIYDQVATLASVTGSYASTVATTGGNDRANFTITPAGLFSGVSAAGCQFQGSLAVRGATHVFNLSITFMGGICANGTATSTGVAYLDESTLYAAALNQTRTSGVLLTATKASSTTSTTTTDTGTAAGSSQANPICYIGPEGGTYTLTATGQKNYDGCSVGTVVAPAATPIVTSTAGTSTSSGGSNSRPTCYVGPNGGTYTLTANGNKNYSGC